MRALAQQIIKSARVLIDALKERHLFYLTVGAFTAAVLGLLATPRTLTVALTTDVSISIPNANLYVGCALAVMGAALVAARAGVWQLQARERVDMENTLRKTYFEFIGGGVLLAGVFLSWTQFQYQVGTTERTLRATQEAQVTERFSRAVDQLGSDRPEQRIGATYALERIAYDSPRDLENVLALLASALRQRARWPAAGEPAREVVSERQAIVTVLGRLNGRVEPARDWRYRSWLDLRATDLRYLTFKGGNYQSFDFSEAAFRGAYLAYSDVSRARFVRSDLREVYMFQVKAQGADFTSTDLSCTVLVKAQLQDARFDKADLHGANLSLAVLEWRPILQCVSPVGRPRGRLWSKCVVLQLGFAGSRPQPRSVVAWS